MSFGDSGSITIRIVNEAKTPLGVDLDALIAAINIQVANHFAPYWGVTATVLVGPVIAEGEWGVRILDRDNLPGAEGYHEFTEDGQPLGYVGVIDTIQAGDLVSVTLSHEILEMLGDRATNISAEDSKGDAYAYEDSDMTEADTYEINNIPVSNFATPAWWEAFRKPGSVKFDYLGLITAPFQLRPSGYISVKHNGSKRWVQIWGPERTKAPRVKHRVMRRHNRHHNAA